MSASDVALMSDEQRRSLLLELRWGQTKEQVCPRCGVMSAHFWRSRSKRWRCRGCAHEFSLTSDTMFHATKLSITKILLGIIAFAEEADGATAMRLRKAMGCQWRTAWLFAQKLREAIWRHNEYAEVDGVIEMDGGYFGGKRRSPNKHGRQRDERAIIKKLEGAPTTRYKRYQQLAALDAANHRRRQRRRVVAVMRKQGAVEGGGACTTYVAVFRSENPTDMAAFASRYIAKNSTVMTDESNAFAPLAASFNHKTVIHSREWVADDGTNENQAESFFSRMRRAEYGLYHGYRPEYLICYAVDSAWREDVRRKSVKSRFRELLKKTLSIGRSVLFQKYYQGHRRHHEILGPADGTRFLSSGGVSAWEVAR
ncbi:MAG: IS1595 family transposase [Ramlibacter sp.]|nr:IS1595 family transposase [Ramlibacter sp.]